jgi:hypothetical protein
MHPFNTKAEVVPSAADIPIWESIGCAEMPLTRARDHALRLGAFGPRESDWQAAVFQRVAYAQYCGGTLGALAMSTGAALDSS